MIVSLSYVVINYYTCYVDNNIFDVPLRAKKRRHLVEIYGSCSNIIFTLIFAHERNKPRNELMYARTYSSEQISSAMYIIK